MGGAITYKTQKEEPKKLKIIDWWTIKREMVNIFNGEPVGMCKSYIRILENGVMEIKSVYALKVSGEGDDELGRCYYRTILGYEVYTEVEIIRASVLIQYHKILMESLMKHEVASKDLI
jgi:hypothetical protein